MSSKTSTDSKYISLREAARILNVHPETLRRWDNSGKLKAIRIGKSTDPTKQHRKYQVEDVIKALNK